MTTPGFTAEAALRPTRPRYGGGAATRRAARAGLVEPQEVISNCSDDGQLCYFCDIDDAGSCGGCDWYYGDYYLASSDCGSWG